MIPSPTCTETGSLGGKGSGGEVGLTKTTGSGPTGAVVFTGGGGLARRTDLGFMLLGVVVIAVAFIGL